MHCGKQLQSTFLPSRVLNDIRISACFAKHDNPLMSHTGIPSKEIGRLSKSATLMGLPKLRRCTAALTFLHVEVRSTSAKLERHLFSALHSAQIEAVYRDVFVFEIGLQHETALSLRRSQSVDFRRDGGFQYGKRGVSVHSPVYGER